METSTRIGFLLLSFLHLVPSAAFVAPKLIRRLYGIDPDGTLGVLLSHRAGLFVAVAAAALFAAISMEGRRLATIVLTISMLGFLLTYVRAGAPSGPLRTIALMDMIGLLPLTFVAYASWRS
jgi:hypothetical protein